jgi:hypothetical protein
MKARQIGAWLGNQGRLLPDEVQLGLCAQGRWRRLRGFEDLAKVITGVVFKEGIEVIQDDQVAA